MPEVSFLRKNWDCSAKRGVEWMMMQVEVIVEVIVAEVGGEGEVEETKEAEVVVVGKILVGEAGAAWPATLMFSDRILRRWLRLLLYQRRPLSKHHLLTQPTMTATMNSRRHCPPNQKVTIYCINLPWMNQKSRGPSQPETHSGQSGNVHRYNPSNHLEIPLHLAPLFCET